MQRRSTHKFVCDRALKFDLAHGSSHPEILTEIFRLADRFAFTPKAERAAAIELWRIFCTAQPCILWQPPYGTRHRNRHINVRLYFDHRGESVISVPRAVWACVHVVPEQGPELEATEEIIHSCGQTAEKNTGRNACLNPAHMVRVSMDDRFKITAARKLMQRHRVLS